VQRSYDLALDEIEEALAIDSTSVDAMWRRGLITLESQGCGGVPSEIECIERELKESGSEADRACLHHLSGRLRLAQGQSAEGLEELNLAVESSERDEFYFYRRELLRGYVEAGSVEEALREGAALLRYNPNDGELLCLLGSASEMMGDQENMRSYYSRAVKTWDKADRDFAPLKAARARL
jgi:tetratricopeptide (TPR) repeat protein